MLDNTNIVAAPESRRTLLLNKMTNQSQDEGQLVVWVHKIEFVQDRLNTDGEHWGTWVIYGKAEDRKTFLVIETAREIPQLLQFGGVDQ
jgi:hypothetical protein